MYTAALAAYQALAETNPAPYLPEASTMQNNLGEPLF
jgi:hypothetical protein